MCTENIKAATCMGTPYQETDDVSCAVHKFFFLSFFFILLTFFRYPSGLITTRHCPSRLQMRGGMGFHVCSSLRMSTVSIEVELINFIIIHVQLNNIYNQCI